MSIKTKINSCNTHVYSHIKIPRDRSTLLTFICLENKKAFSYSCSVSENTSLRRPSASLWSADLDLNTSGCIQTLRGKDVFGCFSTILRAWIIQSASRGVGVSSAVTAAKITGDNSNFHLSDSVQIFCHNPFAILPELIYKGQTRVPKKQMRVLPLTTLGSGFSLQQEKEKKRREVEAASPSGEWQAAHHLGACSRHSLNKGRRGERCGLGMHCFNQPHGSLGSQSWAEPKQGYPRWGDSSTGIYTVGILGNSRRKRGASISCRNPPGT